MATNRVLAEGAGLTAKELAWVEYTWTQEQFSSDVAQDNHPLLKNQQYVLFDEDEMWPSGADWP